jgi:hypothetical protein
MCVMENTRVGFFCFAFFSPCVLFHEDKSASPWHRDNIRHFVFLKPITCLSPLSSRMTYSRVWGAAFYWLPVEQSLPLHKKFSPKSPSCCQCTWAMNAPLRRIAQCLCYLLVLSYCHSPSPNNSKRTELDKTRIITYGKGSYFSFSMIKVATNTFHGLLSRKEKKIAVEMSRKETCIKSVFLTES